MLVLCLISNQESSIKLKLGRLKIYQNFSIKKLNLIKNQVIVYFESQLLLITDSDSYKYNMVALFKQFDWSYKLGIYH